MQYATLLPLPPGRGRREGNRTGSSAMTSLCVPIFVRSLVQAAADVAQAVEAGADLVELRIDEFTDVALLRNFVSYSIQPLILTCRPTWEGGGCELPEDQRLAILDEAAVGRVTYVDIELEAFHRGRVPPIGRQLIV